MVALTRLWATKTRSKLPHSHFCPKGVCSPMYTRLFTSYGPSQYLSSFPNWRQKFFTNFCCRPQKTLVAYCELNQCQQLGIQVLPKSGNPDSLPPKQAVLGVFFYKICFLGQTINFRLQHVIYIWKALTLSYSLAFLEIILMHPTRRQSFANTLQPH